MCSCLQSGVASRYGPWKIASHACPSRYAEREQTLHKGSFLGNWEDGNGVVEGDGVEVGQAVATEEWGKGDVQHDVED